MTNLSLQDAIDRAGSAVRLLWKPNAPRWTPPVVPAEFTGWREEQVAPYETVALSDLSHHIPDLFIKGPDALRLLRDFAVNNLDNFAIGQAKQVVMTTDAGFFIGDGILTRDADEEFTLSAVPFSETWIQYQGEAGDYDVEFTLDADSANRGGGDPVLFRYQIQGPRALELTKYVFGDALPEAKFFHSVPAEIDGHHFRALRHGMQGQPGYEFIGEWKDAEAVKEALLKKGEALGLVQVGARAYSLNSLESGWIPIPTPGIYDGPELRAYREHVSAFSFEGFNPLKGSFFSPDISDYYSTPYELGYGRLISFNHDFVGRNALQEMQNVRSRERVTLVLDPAQTRQVWGGPELAFEQTYGRYRIEADGKLVGLAFATGSVPHVGTMLSLALLDPEYAVPDTEVTFVWGEHPGPGTDPNADLDFTRISAKVQPSPYNEFARTSYRSN